MRAKYSLMLRAVILEVLLLQRVYAPGDSLGPWWSWLPFTLYTAFAVGLYEAARRRLLTETLEVGAFFVDIAFASVILHLTGYVSTDLYIAYFLVILTSCLLEKVAYSLIVGTVACAVYVVLAFPGLEWTESPFYLLRVSLLLVTSFFSAYVASVARRVEQDVEERFEQQITWMQRLSIIGTALSAVFHELKTPLNTIILSAENAGARRKKEKAADIEPNLKMILREAHRASDILGRYLEFAKPTELALEPVDLEPCLAEVLDDMTPRLKDREIVLETDIAGAPRVDGSRKHLIQAFTNVLLNAIEAMPLGGRLKISAAAEDGGAVVSVADTGIGIPQSLRKRLFRPFVTSRDDYEGHGLGLYIVRWIMQKHAGSVELRSPGAGKGTTVVLSFPPAQR